MEDIADELPNSLIDLLRCMAIQNDVLQRVHDAFFSTGSDIHLELYGDSPFVDPLIIDQFLGFFDFLGVHRT